MKKIFAILLILALIVAPAVSLASSAHIESVEFANGRLSGAVSGNCGRCEAVVTLFCVGNWYFTISAPIENDGSFTLHVGGLPCECITIAIKDAMTGAVFDAAMLIL